MKKITADDLITAIGNLDDKLLEYPKKRNVKIIVFKNISIAASFIICIAVSIGAALSGLLSKKDAGINFDSENFAPEINIGTSTQVHTLSFDASGKIKNNTQNENNSLQTHVITNGFVYISLDQDPQASERNKLYIKSESEPFAECEILDITFEKTIYRIELSDGVHLVCNAENAFEIIASVEDGGYKLSVVYNEE